MARTVDEIMNRELLSVGEMEQAVDVLRYVLALEITGVSILDDECHPIGMATLRDLVRAEGKTVGSCMSSPVDTVRGDATIRAAAEQLARTGRHRLVVVDAAGRAVGMLSTLDVIRGILGLPAVHPAGFPHYDAETGLTWSDGAVLAEENVDVAPDGPGVLALVHGGPGIPERVVWAEPCNNVRLRLLELLSFPQTDEPVLARALRIGGLRFRAAAANDETMRKRAAETVMAQARAILRPAARGTA